MRVLQYGLKPQIDEPARNPLYKELEGSIYVMFRFLLILMAELTQHDS